MNEYETIEKKFAIALLQFQTSLNKYLDTTQDLFSAIEKNHSMEEHAKKQSKSTIAQTVSTLVDIQKIVLKKVQLLTEKKNEKNNALPDIPLISLLQDVQDPFQWVKIENKAEHIKKYHLKREYLYRTIINNENTDPPPPWKPIFVKNKRY